MATLRQQEIEESIRVDASGQQFFLNETNYKTCAQNIEEKNLLVSLQLDFWAPVTLTCARPKPIRSTFSKLFSLWRRQISQISHILMKTANAPPSSRLPGDSVWLVANTPTKTVVR